MTDLLEMFRRFGVALAIGLLIGVEREREQVGKFAGIRTFPLLTLMGCLSALIAESYAPWTFPVAFAVVAAFVLRSYVITGSAASPGITTEVATLIAFLLGGLVWWGLGDLAAALAVAPVLLLATTRPLEELAQRIGQEDIRAALQFGVITLIVLPILPNRAFGPLAVLNPYRVWLMVVLIAGVNLVGYALARILGSRQGFLLAGVLGGLASSTAVALGFSRRSRKEPDAEAPPLALGILLASTIMFGRVLVIAATVNPHIGRALIQPMLFAGIAGAGGCLFLWRTLQRQAPAAPAETTLRIQNPFELWPAIQFGLLFAAILLVAKAAQVYVGAQGVYVSSLLTGLADVDAITLSLSSLATHGIGDTVAARGIVLAAVANTFTKAAIVAVLGTPRLRRQALPAFAALALAALAAAFLV